MQQDRISVESVFYSGVAIFLSYHLYKKLFAKKSAIDELPGPEGVVERVRGIRASLDRKSHEYFMDWARKTDFGMFKIQVLSPRQSVIVCDAQAAKQILTSKEFMRSDQFQVLTQGLLDHALFVLGTGENHKKHRKLLQPGFGPVHLRTASRVSNQKMNQLEEVWTEKFGKGADITINANLYKTLTTVAMDIISLVAFGHDLKSVDKLSEKDEAHWDALDVLTGSSLTLRAILPRFLWKWVGVDSNSPHIKQAREEIHSLLKSLAEERLKKGLDVEGSTWGQDVLQRLLKGGEDGTFTQEEIFGELLGFFLAGHETTSNTLTFACLELCRHRDVQEKLFEDVKSIDLDTFDNPAEPLSSLKYLDAVFKEVQRLHSIVGSVGRTSTEEVTVLGRTFPKGTVFQCYIRAIHLNPLYYKDPNVFNPDRWLDSDSLPPNGAFIPFSEGVHNCIGRKMAEIEFKIILLKLVQRYRLSLAKDAKIELFTTITHGLKNGLQCSLSRR